MQKPTCFHKCKRLHIFSQRWGVTVNDFCFTTIIIFHTTLLIYIGVFVLKVEAFHRGTTHTNPKDG